MDLARIPQQTVTRYQSTAANWPKTRPQPKLLTQRVVEVVDIRNAIQWFVNYVGDNDTTRFAIDYGPVNLLTLSVIAKLMSGTRVLPAGLAGDQAAKFDQAIAILQSIVVPLPEQQSGGDQCPEYQLMQQVTRKEVLF